MLKDKFFSRGSPAKALFRREDHQWHLHCLALVLSELLYWLEQLLEQQGLGHPTDL